jgi:hypothetical protein
MLGSEAEAGVRERGSTIAAEVLLGLLAILFLVTGGAEVAMVVALLGVAAWLNPAPFGWMIVLFTLLMLAFLLAGVSLMGATRGELWTTLGVVCGPGLVCGAPLHRCGTSSRRCREAHRRPRTAAGAQRLDG